MDDVVRFKVSASGQISLPADARRRWGVPNGGTVEVIDLGWGVLVVPPGGTHELRADLLPSPAEHAAFVAGLDDPDLATT